MRSFEHTIRKRVLGSKYIVTSVEQNEQIFAENVCSLHWFPARVVAGQYSNFISAREKDRFFVEYYELKVPFTRDLIYTGSDSFGSDPLFEGAFTWDRIHNCVLLHEIGSKMNPHP